MRYNNANYFYQKNHQGSVTEITAANQSTVKSYQYDAFGNILQETGPSVPGGLTYTSRQYHSRSGLYYYRARWYDPELGRFLTPDPIGHLGGVNLYAYVGNAPVDLVDPLGLIWGEAGPPIRFGGSRLEPTHSALQDILGPNNWDFFTDFILGMGDRIRNYNKDCPQAREMAASPGADALRAWFYGGNPGPYEYKWTSAFLDTFGDSSNTAFQVGGFIGTAVDNGDRTVTFTINNIAGTHSFFYHLPFVPDRNGTTGPMRTIYQTFTWTESIPPPGGTGTW